MVGVNFAALGRVAGLEVNREEMIWGPFEVEVEGRDGPAAGGSRAIGRGREGGAREDADAFRGVGLEMTEDGLAGDALAVAFCGTTAILGDATGGEGCCIGWVVRAEGWDEGVGGLTGTGGAVIATRPDC